MTDSAQTDPAQTGETAGHLDPARAALMIMDVQPSITAQLPDEPAFLTLIGRVRERARAAGMHIGYVRVGLTDDEALAVSPNNRTFHAGAASGRMHADAPHSQVHPQLTPAPDEFVVRKSRVGAFSTTDLAQKLEERGVDTLVLCGIATSGVILSTVRDAADHDYRLYVLEDASFDRDPEVHRVLTTKVFPRQAEVISSDEFLALLPA